MKTPSFCEGSTIHDLAHADGRLRLVICSQSHPSFIIATSSALGLQQLLNHAEMDEASRSQLSLW